MLDLFVNVKTVMDEEIANRNVIVNEENSWKRLSA